MPCATKTLGTRISGIAGLASEHVSLHKEYTLPRTSTRYCEWCTGSVKFCSKLNHLFFGYFDPVSIILIIKINISRGDLSGISAETATLSVIQERSALPLFALFCEMNAIMIVTMNREF